MSVTEEENSRSFLRRGQYIGEVSAICFLHLPPHVSSLPLLLAGTGSQIIAYDIATRNTLRCFQVFDGIRVHGIALEEFGQRLSDTGISFRIAVYGERRVKLYNLCVHAIRNSRSGFELELTLIHSLPKFRHWILDVCFFNFKEFSNSSTQGSLSLAVGCSDNSVCFWDIFSCNIVSHVKSADRCLLYSMRMWNGKLDSLFVASGTIYNEIVVWKVNVQYHHSSVLSDPAKGCGIDSFDVGSKPFGEQCCASQVCRLIGHEGSIFRMAWSSDGLKLLSVSDDRSARVWTVKGDGLCNHDDFVSHLAGPVLFGHCARVWDCCMSDDLLITAGEDCTCRVWGLDGVQLKVIKEHMGRGVWRCLYDPISSLLVTAGFDSAIKVHQLNTSSKTLKRCTNAQEKMNGKMEVFAVHLPNSFGHVGLMDSKSEYVRCLQFSCEDSFYVATNNGYLYHAFLSGNGEVKWTELVHIGEQAPIVCMDLLTECSNLSDGIQHWVAVGDGKGNATILHIVGDIWSPKVKVVLTWSAEMERQLLGIFWCKSIGYRFIFTADPRGTLKFWRLCDPSSYIAHHSGGRSYNSCLMAEFVSCFGLRIMCLDASFEEEVLVCGDIRGNLLLFPLSWSNSTVLNVASQEKVNPLNYFKGAHGISSMCSITIASSSSTQVEICSTGQDGCICYLEHDRDRCSLDFIGMKLVKELSTLQSVFCNSSCDDDTEYCQYAIGFASSDFVIWNLTAETEVLKVPCGGWRRPHSYYIGNIPESKNCFGFVKNEIIYIHRHWLHDSEPKLHPQNLHLQFHGREIHSICFVIRDLECNSNTKHGLASKSCWIATGCEDGTMRLTRYEPCLKNWSTSKLLGEHVGGSAVRSICCVSKMYTVMPNGIGSLKEDLKDLENPFLLISVGAKKVVTAWKQKSKTTNKREAFDLGIRVENRCNISSSCEASPSISFQWLSTDMPTKIRCHEKQQNAEGLVGSPGGSDARTCNEILRPQLVDGGENDWRYLAVTAFLVRVAGFSFSVCFVVVACSDATVTLRALLLPCRQWFDVAILTPLLSPVLAMKHIIVPQSGREDNLCVGSVYIVVMGSTDGSIAFWDLTEVIENFIQQISSIQLNDYFDCQKRPRTGRGSQGGRRWRSLGTEILKRKSGDGHTSNSHFKNGGNFGKTIQNHILHQPSEMLQYEQNADACNQSESHASRVSEEAADTTSFGICEIEPLHTLNNVHQSGVNCLCVSDTKDLSISKERSTLYVLSGGDDQAINCLRFDISWNNDQDLNKDGCDTAAPLEGMNDCIHTCRTRNYFMRFLLLDKIKSAHASAVKGVWTDGNWVFSTGLDQRVRCWILDQHGKLIEHAHLVTSVPEPEALEALACDRNEYQIAVAGRGMQMVEFCAHSSHKQMIEN